jgi:two-component system chemotaxis response regulator CheB
MAPNLFRQRASAVDEAARPMSPLRPAHRGAACAAERPIRVMIVDDSVVARGLVARWLTETGAIEVVCSQRDGTGAVALIATAQPDIVLLDIEMPEMDGITALPALLRQLPTAKVIMMSALTTRHAEVTLRALRLGAADYIAKPTSNRDLTVEPAFKTELVGKVMALAGRSEPPPAVRVARVVDSAPPGRAEPVAAPALRPLHIHQRPQVLVIGASTGGPNAVSDLLRDLRPSLDRVPVIVVQHMPAVFTRIFAEHLSRQLGMPVAEAANHGPLLAGHVYVAPGGTHLKLSRVSGQPVSVIDTGPAVNFCRPSVDVTFHSAARVFGGGTLAVVLTGMGSDGCGGAAQIVQRGGQVLVQDEASSTVWGMPGAIAREGLASAVQPVASLARTIESILRDMPL